LKPLHITASAPRHFASDNENIRGAAMGSGRSHARDAQIRWRVRACAVATGLSFAAAAGAQAPAARTDVQWIVEPGGLMQGGHTGAPMASCQPRRGDRVRVHMPAAQANPEASVIEVSVLSGACSGTRGWLEQKRLNGSGSTL
jgi:hypothetical protein